MIRRTDSAVSVERPPRRNIFEILFLPLWLMIFSVALVSSRGQSKTSIPVLALFAFVGVFLGYKWFWNLAGREIVEFSPDGVIQRKILLGTSRVRVFSFNGIEGLRYESSRARGRRIMPSAVVFGYEGKDLRILQYVSQSEVNEIVAGVVKAFPELTPVYERLRSPLSATDFS